jgi:hypothetical protein
MQDHSWDKVARALRMNARQHELQNMRWKVTSEGALQVLRLRRRKRRK